MQIHKYKILQVRFVPDIALQRPLCLEMWQKVSSTCIKQGSHDMELSLAAAASCIVGALNRCVLLTPFNWWNSFTVLFFM